MVEREESRQQSPALDELRRRLYRADATDADVQRYLLERAEAPDDPDEPPARPVRPVSRLRHGRRPLVGAAALLALAAALVLAVQHDRLLPVAAPTPSERAQEAIGDGQVLEVEDTVSDPVAAATSVGGVAAVGQRFTGRGDAVVAFDPPPDAAEGGRAMVVLTSGDSTPVAWRALLVMRPDGRTTSQLQVLAQGRTEAPWGMAGPTVFDCPTGPPTRIAVQAPDGAAWTLLVAATGRTDSRLH